MCNLTALERKCPSTKKKVPHDQLQPYQNSKLHDYNSIDTTTTNHETSSTNGNTNHTTGSNDTSRNKDTTSKAPPLTTTPSAMILAERSPAAMILAETKTSPTAATMAPQPTAKAPPLITTPSAMRPPKTTTAVPLAITPATATPSTKRREPDTNVKCCRAHKITSMNS